MNMDLHSKFFFIILVFSEPVSLEIAIAPETLYERSWTGSMLFPIDITTLLYPSSSFHKKLGLRWARNKC